MGFFDKVSQVQRSVTESTKTTAETVNLKKKIAYENDRIMEIFAEIGQRFYENQDGDHAIEKTMCLDIDDRKRRIASMQMDLGSLKGFRVCSGCGARFDDKYTFNFCGNCGGKLSEL